MFDPQTDLELNRAIKAAPEKVWRCWTEPDLLMQWFCPAPWTVTKAEIDLRPGGRFFTRMEGPNGEGEHMQMDSEGCFLDVVPQERLVFTDALRAGWRPNAQSFMTACITFAPDGSGGTAYRARVLHNDAAAQAKHLEMGFHDGWRTAADQLAALATSL